ncbi:hypothetical protein, partial [Nostoc sp.]|uniref:hypothetical protein n=1 Tax=Nostoc sp. TaxID=1180 RepID=UPI002FF7932C
GIGKWRLTTRVDGNKPQGLCTHRHDSYDEAWKCVEAWMMAKKLSGDSILGNRYTRFIRKNRLSEFIQQNRVEEECHESSRYPSIWRD